MQPVTAIASAQLWTITAVVAVMDVILAALLTRLVRPPWSPGQSSTLLILGATCFAVLFAWAFRTYWDSCYGAALPAWMRTLAPVVGAVEGAMGWLFWWVARRVSRATVITFLILGGLESLPGHLHAIYGRGLLEHCLPVLGVTPASALVFGFFEYAFYWSVILLLSSVVARVIGPAGNASAPHTEGA